MKAISTGGRDLSIIVWKIEDGNIKAVGNIRK
jgi:hypothetical protein